ncbi:MAG: ATP-binding protein [Anaerotignum sp.]|nr:ATP-binding protein [Anaerotignum sp.]
MKEKFDQSLAHIPFRDYGEYMEYLFACVNLAMDAHLTQMKRVFATGQGGYKNVLYPDLEVAADVCTERIERFRFMGKTEKEEIEENTVEDLPEELLSLFGNFAEETLPSAAEEKDSLMTPEKQLELVAQRAEATLDAGVSLPFYELCRKLEMDSFTVFCFVSGILASTQTDYAAVYQVINENGGLSAPTIESAAKLYFGENFSIAGAYGDMSACLEQLMPVLNLRVQGNMPFSTVVSPDKRMIDFLFGKNPMRLDENYVRFFKMLTDGKELDPIMANENILDAMKISFEEGVRIFSYFGDEGSGRKFFVKHFCQEKGMNAVSVNCKKLFIYDYQYVDQALWAVTRECILTNACCVLDELTFREDEKEKFYGYMDLAFGKLNAQGITVFAISKEKLQMKEITREEFTELELPTPSNQERENCWKYFSKGYGLGNDIELPEMATKFLFTPGKISSALKNARSLATMDKDILIPRKTLFQGCYNQMSSELTQKATKVKANFGFEDIVMNKDQRETLEHAIDQMNFRKKVYDNWDYNKKYPYGRGLSILLFGAPGTGKSMCAQVIAHELNLELYRVDLSKVIDKYVGETEKSISMIFREAKKCNVVLFFDECDTLFAKRSDDGGSNQASNNNKTALLLQEVEAYDGVSVLATNYKHNIDPAFFRRMKYIVEFEFPDVDTREMLWRTTIPKSTPLGEDVDIRFLAERFEFVGGNIKNCILNAAFLAAAENGEEVCMRHYLQAIRYEFIKVGKVFTRADFEPYAHMVGL